MLLPFYEFERRGFSLYYLDSSRSSNFLINLLVCSAKLNVKTYRALVLSPYKVLMMYSQCVAGYAPSGQRTLCTLPTVLQS